MISQRGNVREARGSEPVAIEETICPVLTERTEDDEKRQRANVRTVDDENRRSAISRTVSSRAPPRIRARCQRRSLS